MAELTVSNTGFTTSAGATINRRNKAGESVTAGQAVYPLTSGGVTKWMKAQCDGTLVQAGASGIALNDAALDEDLAVITAGSIDLGATLTAGETYVLGTTFGKIMPVGDLAATNYLTYLGYAEDESTFVLRVLATGVQHG